MLIGYEQALLTLHEWLGHVVLVAVGGPHGLAVLAVEGILRRGEEELPERLRPLARARGEEVIVFSIGPGERAIFMLSPA